VTDPVPNVDRGRPSAVRALLQSLVDNAQARADNAVSVAIEEAQRAAPPFPPDRGRSKAANESLDIDHVLADFDSRMNDRDARLVEAESVLASRQSGFVGAPARLPGLGSQVRASDKLSRTGQEPQRQPLQEVEPVPDLTPGEADVGSTKSRGSSRELKANLITVLVVLGVVVVAVLAISILV